MREDNAIVLDYLPAGYMSSFKKEPIVQAIGENYFALLELVPKDDAKMNIMDKVYIGPDKRDHIKYIKGRLLYERLTTTAKVELKKFIEEDVKKNEKKYVEFFNKTGPITIKQHSLELIPNIGKKHMWNIIEEREKKPFESFKDMTERVKLMPDPHRVIVERIIIELEGQEKFYLFVKALPRQR